MRRIGELMREMGFNPESSEDTQRAFVRHLTRAARQTSSRNYSQTPELKPREQQLSFDPEILGLPTEMLPAKKSGS